MTPMFGRFFNYSSLEKKMRKLFAFIIAGLVLAGCNTIEGVGKDVKKGGEVIEKAAEKAKG
jgi:predicted small secreted protein